MCHFNETLFFFFYRIGFKWKSFYFFCKMPVENSKDGVLHSGKIIYFFQANERKLLNLHLLTIFTKPLITLFGFLKFDISSMSLKFKGSFDYFNVGK